MIAYLMEFKANYGPHLIIVPNAVIVNWKVSICQTSVCFWEFYRQIHIEDSSLTAVVGHGYNFHMPSALFAFAERIVALVTLCVLHFLRWC